MENNKMVYDGSRGDHDLTAIVGQGRDLLIGGPVGLREQRSAEHAL